MGKRGKKKVKSPATIRPSEVEPKFRSSPFQEALKDLKRAPPPAAAPAQPAAPKRASRPTPEARYGRGAGLSEDDRDALGMAMVGVTPLADRGPRRIVRGGEPAESRTAGAAAEAEGAEERARARLDALVAGGVSFQVEWNDEYVRGVRTGLDAGVLRRLSRRRGADDTLDLHGHSRAEARRALGRFVRDAHRRGLDLVCVVHGKGLHSEGGFGVLRELSVDTLTESGCAPCVRAFCTAPASLGGSGALLVELARR